MAVPAGFGVPPEGGCPRTRGEDREDEGRVGGRFSVEVAVEVIFKVIKRGLRIIRNPLFLFGSGGWI